MSSGLLIVKNYGQKYPQSLVSLHFYGSGGHVFPIGGTILDRDANNLELALILAPAPCL